MANFRRLVGAVVGLVMSALCSVAMTADATTIIMPTHEQRQNLYRMFAPLAERAISGTVEEVRGIALPPSKGRFVRVRVHVDDYIKGEAVPADTISFSSDLRGIAVGDTGVFALYSCLGQLGALNTFVAIRRGDSARVIVSEYTTGWSAYRDSIARYVATPTVADIARSATLAVEGQVVSVAMDMNAAPIRRTGIVSVMVRRALLAATLPDSGSILDVNIPSDTKYKNGQVPYLTVGDSVMVFLAGSSGDWRLAPSPYAVWQVSNGAAVVNYECLGAMSRVYSLPLSELIGMLD